MRDEVYLVTRIEVGRADMSGKDDGSISTLDRNRIKKLRKLAKVGDLISAGEGRTRVELPG